MLLRGKIRILNVKTSSDIKFRYYVEREKYLLICLLISQLAHFPHRLVLFTTVLALLPSLLGGAGVGWVEGPKNFIKLESKYKDKKVRLCGDWVGLVGQEM